MYSKMAISAARRVSQGCRQISSALMVLKKGSTTARQGLAKQDPERGATDAAPLMGCCTNHCRAVSGRHRQLTAMSSLTPTTYKTRNWARYSRFLCAMRSSTMIDAPK